MNKRTATSDAHIARVTEREQKCADLTCILESVRKETEHYQSLFDVNKITRAMYGAKTKKDLLTNLTHILDRDFLNFSVYSAFSVVTTIRLIRFIRGF
jgi:hypothetical protein